MIIINLGCQYAQLLLCSFPTMKIYIKTNMGQTADDLARSEEYSRLAIYVEIFRLGYT